MTQKIVCLALALALGFAASDAHAQRGKEGGKPGGKEESKQGAKGGGKEEKKEGRGEPAGKAPGGSWSESKQQPPAGHKEAGAADAEKNKQNQTTGGQKAAAGAAAANRNEPKTTGAEGAAAGAAAANRNEPKTTGAEGAAAGAAVANRNAPKTTGAEGAVAGAAAASRRGPQAAGADAAAVGYSEVRKGFERNDLYGQAWHDSNPNAWTATGWAAGSAWNEAAWTDVAAHCGFGNHAPLSFDYGTNVTCVNGAILQDGHEIATAEEFSQQASSLALEGAAAQVTPSEKWLPLGVFAMVQNEQQHPHLILQIAINEKGALRGNYTDTVTDNNLSVQGGVDPKTQRAAWTVGTNSNSVLEAGLSNLTEGHAPALLHKNGKTERWILVRMQQPK